MLMTSYGFVPWDDSHHSVPLEKRRVERRAVALHQRNNTPRIARIDLTDMHTREIIEIPTAPATTPRLRHQNTEYVVSATRFSVPTPQRDVSISEYKMRSRADLVRRGRFRDGKMSLAFQIHMPGFDYDLPGRARWHPTAGRSSRCTTASRPTP